MRCVWPGKFGGEDRCASEVALRVTIGTGVGHAYVEAWKVCYTHRDRLLAVTRDERLSHGFTVQEYPWGNDDE